MEICIKNLRYGYGYGWAFTMIIKEEYRPDVKVTLKADYVEGYFMEHEIRVSSDCLTVDEAKEVKALANEMLNRANQIAKELACKLEHQRGK